MVVPRPSQPLMMTPSLPTSAGESGEKFHQWKNPIHTVSQAIYPWTIHAWKLDNIMVNLLGLSSSEWEGVFAGSIGGAPTWIWDSRSATPKGITPKLQNPIGGCNTCWSPFYQQWVGLAAISWAIVSPSKSWSMGLPGESTRFSLSGSGFFVGAGVGASGRASAICLLTESSDLLDRGLFQD